MPQPLNSLELPVSVVNNDIYDLVEDYGPEAGWFIIKIWTKLVRQKDHTLNIMAREITAFLVEATGCSEGMVALLLDACNDQKLLNVHTYEGGFIIRSDFMETYLIGSILRRRKKARSARKKSVKNKKKERRIVNPKPGEKHFLIHWIETNAPLVMDLKMPLTDEQAKKLIKTFGEEKVKDALLFLQNNPGRLMGKTSAYYVCGTLITGGGK